MSAIKTILLNGNHDYENGVDNSNYDDEDNDHNNISSTVLQTLAMSS